MRRTLILLAAGGLLLGCSDDGGNADTVDEPDDATTTTDATAADNSEDSDEGDEAASDPGAGSMDEVVITLEDLPAGWTTGAADDDESDDDFCGVAAPTDLAEPVEEAESSFQQSDFGPFLSSVAGRFESDEVAAQLLEDFSTGFEACNGYTEVDENGTETTYSIEPLSFPDLGDDTFSVRLAASTALGPFALDVVFTRVDDVLLGVVNGGFGAADTAVTEEAMRIMVERV